jgi:YD repeat-containing protein
VGSKKEEETAMQISKLMKEPENLRSGVTTGADYPTPPGWAAGQPPDADLRWRPAPDPCDGSLLQDPDFTLPTAAGPLNWNLFYNSTTAATDSPWGSGRRASWPLTLASDGTTVTVMHEDGADRQYLKSGSNYLVQNVPSGDTLVNNGAAGWDETRGDTGYKFHYPAGNFVSCAYWATPQDLRITCSYDANQRLQSLLEPAGRWLTISYSADGRVQYIQDWGNRQNVVLTYVGSDLTETWGPAGCMTRYHYDSNHLLTTITDPEGYQTTYTYDSANRVLTRSVAGSLGRYTYVTSGPTLSTGYTDPNGHTWTHVSTSGYPAGQIDPQGNRETYVYASGRPQRFMDALGNCTTFTFNASGYQTGFQDSLGNCVTYTRDASGNLLTQVDPTGAVTSYSYGTGATARQLQTVTDPLGRVTSYSYQANGLPQTVIDPLGNCTTYVWNSQGLLTSEMNPLGC